MGRFIALKNNDEDIYLNRIVIYNQLSSIISFLPPLFAVLIGLEIRYFALILTVQTISIVLISILKYQLERKLGKSESDILPYVLRNTFSYLIISISIPFAVFLIDLFYRLSPVVRVISLNFLFVLGLLFLLSNLPASRIIRISEPLDDPYLIKMADTISSRLGTVSLNIYVIKALKFKIANAAQIGARKFYVFVSSYLLENLTPDENVAVIAHEFAHAKKRHVLKIVIISWIVTVVGGNLLLLPLDTNIFPFLSFIFPIAGLSIIIVSSIFVIPFIQRHFETEADLIATEIFAGEKLVSALEKINRLNMGPEDISRHWNMSHPATADRIRKIREYSEKS